jgi:serine/threonine protein kinase
MMDLPLGTVIHGYFFNEIIGRGGYSTVYKVFSERFGVEFAAKVLLPDSAESLRMHQSYADEINALINLNHPNIILLYDYFYQEGVEFMILELCKHGSLVTEVQATENKGLDMKRFTSIATQLISALDFCHSQNISHRDIKPANILIDDYGRPKLADFGIAGRGVEDRSHVGAGTWAYFAPEVLMNQSTDRCKADVWALGVTFAYCLEGHLPWPTNRATMYQSIMYGAYTINRNIPPVLADLLYRMFTVNPEARWSASQLKDHPFFTQQEACPVVKNPSMRRLQQTSQAHSLRTMPLRSGIVLSSQSWRKTSADTDQPQDPAGPVTKPTEPGVQQSTSFFMERQRRMMGEASHSKWPSLRLK